jgi:hypothetical protein
MILEESMDLPLDIHEKEKNAIQDDNISRFEEFSLSSECFNKQKIDKNDEFELETINSDHMTKFLGLNDQKNMNILEKQRALSENTQEISNSKLRKKVCLKMHQVLNSSYNGIEKGKVRKIILNLEKKIRILHPNMKGEYKNYCIDLMKILKVHCHLNF